jgi:hypothetical protein
VRVDYRYAILHDKFIVADGATVETGSFNFTSRAGWKRLAEADPGTLGPAAGSERNRPLEALWPDDEQTDAAPGRVRGDPGFVRLGEALGRSAGRALDGHVHEVRTSTPAKLSVLWRNAGQRAWGIAARSCPANT